MNSSIVRLSAVVGLCFFNVACGSSASPAAPTPTVVTTTTPAPTVSPTWSLTGSVTETSPTTSVTISGATVTVIDGPDAGKSTTTSASGAFSLTGLKQAGFSVTASRAGYASSSQGVTLDGNKSVTFRLAPLGPRTQFPAGTYLVNSEVAAGRYFADPISGCYWERLSGLGGTLGEIIANDFVSYNAAQIIVDIASSDRAFSGDADCGTWFNTPRAGAQSAISPGMWLVGSQVPAGTYRATVGSGCYWERLRNFSGTLSAIIANNFISSAGSQLVTISAGDAGFNTDGDCGTWSLVGSSSTFSLDQPVQTADDINAKRAQQRSGWRR